MLSLVSHQHCNSPPPIAHIFSPPPNALYPQVQPCHASSGDLDDDLFNTLEAPLYVSSDESDSNCFDITELMDTPHDESSLSHKLHQAQAQLMESGGYVCQGAILGAKGEYLAKKRKAILHHCLASET